MTHLLPRLIQALLVCGTLSACTVLTAEQTMTLTLHEARKDLDAQIQHGNLSKWDVLVRYVGMVGDAYRQPYTNELQALALSLGEQVKKGSLTEDAADMEWQQEIERIN